MSDTEPRTAAQSITVTDHNLNARIKELGRQIDAAGRRVGFHKKMLHEASNEMKRLEQEQADLKQYRLNRSGVHAAAERAQKGGEAERT